MSTTSATETTLSPWFAANEYRPTMVGPYECRMVMMGLPSERTHMRWWNGERWSFPIEWAGPNSDVSAPPATHYPTTEDSITESLSRFEWRGFNEDQDPL